MGLWKLCIPMDFVYTFEIANHTFLFFKLTSAGIAVHTRVLHMGSFLLEVLHATACSLAYGLQGAPLRAE